MNLIPSQNSTQGNGKPTFMAWAAGWLASCIALFAAIFLTPDLWSHFEPDIRDAIYSRYTGNWARFFTWLSSMALYPLVYFGTQALIGASAVGAVLAAIVRVTRRNR